MKKLIKLYIDDEETSLNHKHEMLLGLCKLVDKYLDEFLNEMYVALHNDTIIEDRYLPVYNEYL